MKKAFIRNNTTAAATYVDERYYRYIEDRERINTIIEAGSRDLLDALELEKIYPNATILSFECNPECIEVCNTNLKFSQGRIRFFPIALSNLEGDIDFYSFDSNKTLHHDAGCSSLYQHKNVDDVPMSKITVKSRKLSNILYENKITTVDLLCLDLQGGELNLIKGLEHYFQTVKYIITEFDSEWYQNAPSSLEYKQFLECNNFRAIFSESDVVFKRFNL